MLIAVDRTHNEIGAPLNSHDAKETRARDYNVIHEVKIKLEGKTHIWDNNIKMDSKGTMF